MVINIYATTKIKNPSIAFLEHKANYFYEVGQAFES